MKFTVSVQDLDGQDAVDLIQKLTAMGSNGSIVPGASFKENDEYSATGNESEFDSNNMPWDERIHASTKTKNKDGTWKRGRNVDDAVFAAVEAELRVKTTGAVVVPTVAPAMGNAPEPVAAVGYVAPAVVPTVAPAIAAPVALPVAANIAPAIPAPVAITRDFKGLMQQISNLFAAKTIDPSYPNTIVQRINVHAQHFGGEISTLTDISNDPRRVEYAWQCLDADGNGLKKAA